MGSKPLIASPLLRSTTTYSVVAASVRQDNPSKDNPSAPLTASRRQRPAPALGGFRGRRRAAIVLPILWRFGCGRAAKLGYRHDKAVKCAIHAMELADGHRLTGHDPVTRSRRRSVAGAGGSAA